MFIFVLILILVLAFIYFLPIIYALPDALFAGESASRLRLHGIMAP
jgi:hypothetical protein